MTKVIWIFIILLVIFCGWQGFKYWERVGADDEKKSTTIEVRPEYLQGLPSQLQQGYDIAKQKGPSVMREWLKAHGDSLQDPRKAWIELDFCVSIARENPAEARHIFSGVKERTPQTSPVWPRVKELQRTFE